MIINLFILFGLWEILNLLLLLGLGENLKFIAFIGTWGNIKFIAFIGTWGNIKFIAFIGTWGNIIVNKRKGRNVSFFQGVAPTGAVFFLFSSFSALFLCSFSFFGYSSSHSNSSSHIVHHSLKDVSGEGVD